MTTPYSIENNVEILLAGLDESLTLLKWDSNYLKLNPDKCKIGGSRGLRSEMKHQRNKSMYKNRLN